MREKFEDKGIWLRYLRTHFKNGNIVEFWVYGEKRSVRVGDVCKNRRCV